MWRALGICLSLANLIFLRSWLDLLRLASESPGEMRSAPAFALFSGTLLNVLIAGAIFFAAYRVVRSLRIPWLETSAHCAFLLLTLIPIDVLGWQVYQQVDSQFKDFAIRPIWTLLLTVPLLGCMLLGVYHRRGVLKGTRSIVFLLTPLLPLNVLSFARAAWESPGQEQFQGSAPQSGIPVQRVVWLIFDEFDQRLAFEVRPKSIEMPEFDRLLSECFYATNALPPGPDTPESITSLITGLPVEKFDSHSKALALHLRDGSIRSLPATPTVFDDAQKLHFNTSLVGWFLPYCSALGDSLTHCSQPQETSLWSRSPWTVMGEQWRDHYEHNVISSRFGGEAKHSVPWFGFTARKEQLAGYRFILADAMREVRDPTAGLLFIHWPIPHPLGIYSRHTHKLGTEFDNNYIDNLELTSRTLGQLREAMEQAGLWDRTLLIISSDHPLRPPEWKYSATWTDEERRLSKGRTYPHIPFLVHFPGQAHSYKFEVAFNTIAMKQLVPDLLLGTISTPEQLARRLTPK